MTWRRLGRILAPPCVGAWATSHAAHPFVRPTGEDVEMLFSSRDGQGRSHTGRARLALERAGTGTAAEVAQAPLLGPGALGAFDDSGAMGSCVVYHEGREHLYYIGWARGVTVPFVVSIGCAVSEDGGASFARVSRAPVVGRSDADPFLATTPWVTVENGRWRMWYASGVSWEATPAGPKHYYRIVYAESRDGLTWSPTGRVCIDFADDSEYAICRPCVVRDGDIYRMWFSYRGDAYRIGYAESADGLDWHRDDGRAGLVASGEGWESRSVEYGCVFDHGGARWMLYNGDNYGASGIGLAVLEDRV